MDEEGGYTVDVNTLLNDEKIWRVITNGHPYKKFKGLSDDEAYFATKQAIYCAMGKMKTSQFKGATNHEKDIVNVIKSLANIGLHGTDKPKAANLQINKSGSFVEDGNYYSQTYNVSADVDIGSYEIQNISGFPTGSFTADSKGNSKTSFSGGEAFKVMIPKSGLSQNINGNILVKAKCKTYPILVGKTRDPKTQDYVLTGETYEDLTAPATLKLNTNNGTVQVKKVDAENPKTIQGVTFQLLKPDGTQVATATTNADGIANFTGLFPGEYKLREIDTDKSYILNSEVFDITVEYDKTTYKTVYNYHKKGNIQINKTDSETLKPIEGVTFQLLDINGNVIETTTTNADGQAYFNNLRIGKYLLKEVETKPNYMLNTATFEVEVEYNKTTIQNVENEYKRGNLIVNKVDKDNRKIGLGNIIFDLFSNEFKKVIGTYATDVNGKLEINNLRIGSYSLIEKNAGKWYELAKDTAIDIKFNETTKTVIENELKKGQIKVIKVDKENYEIKLPGVEFEILDENDKVLEKVVTDANGEALTKRYPIRDFAKLKIREVKTLDNYELEKVVTTIDLDEGITDVMLTNVRKRGLVEITKVSANDNKLTGEKKGTQLKGAVFEIYTKDDVLVDTITTGEDGKCISELLEYGKYYVREKSTGSENYILNTERYDFEIKDNGEIIEITIENKSKEVPPKLPQTGF